MRDMMARNNRPLCHIGREVLNMDPETIIRQLGLQPHPEGGFYRETYRSSERIAATALWQRAEPLDGDLLPADA
jgi:Cupin superfamily (DUF985)